MLNLLASPTEYENIAIEGFSVSEGHVPVKLWGFLPMNHGDK